MSLRHSCTRAREVKQECLMPDTPTPIHGMGIVRDTTISMIPTPASAMAKIHSGFFFVRRHIDAVAIDTAKREVARPKYLPTRPA